jgi:hypothetical protein
MTHPLSKSSSRKKKRKSIASNPSSGSASGTPAGSSVKRVTSAPTVSRIPAAGPRVWMPNLPATPRPSSLVAAPKTVQRPGRPLRAPAEPMPLTGVPKTVAAPGRPLRAPAELTPSAQGAGPRVRMPNLPATPRSSLLVAAPKTVKRPARPLQAPAEALSLEGAPKTVKRPARPLQAPAEAMPLEGVPKTGPVRGGRLRAPAVTVPPEGVPKTGPVRGGRLRAPAVTVPPEGIPGRPLRVPVEPTQSAEPLSVPPTRTFDLLNKTRRKSVELSARVPGSAVGAERSRKNAAANAKAMGDLYKLYYRSDGNRLPNAKVNAVYNLMGTGKTNYGKAPVTARDFRRFMETPNTTINGQKVSDYRARMRAWEAGDKSTPPPTGPKTEAESVQNGDYFHVHNGSYQRPNKKGTARRIIVNVNTQKAGLKVTAGLNALINADPKVAANLSEYKIYLSQKEISGPMKHDKLVIYYSVDPTDPDGSDTIGNRIAAKISSSIKPADIDQGFAPFYSNIAPGLAWAEEPKYYVSTMGGSFTTTRSEIIKKVIADSPVIRSKEEFIKKVNDSLNAAGVDETSPHRHQVAQ